MRVKFKNLFILLLVAALAFTIFFKNQIIISGVKDGILMCGNVLIPALFPFMVLVLFISKSSLSYYLAKVVSPFTTRVLHLPSAAGAAVALSYLGGYPMGLKSASYLYNNGVLNKNQVQRISLFAVNASPVFIFTAVGVIMLKNALVGALLLMSIFSASILIGVAQGLHSRFIAKNTLDNSAYKYNAGNLNGHFISATNDASISMLNICGFAIIFSVIYSICINLFNNAIILSLVNTTLEVVISCQYISGTYNYALLAAIIAFGGFSAIFQVLSVCSELDLSILPFILARMANAVLAFIIMSVLLRIFPIASTVMSNHVEPVANNFSVSIPASFALIGLACVFVLSLRFNRNKPKY